MAKIKNVIFDIGNVLADFRWKEFMIERGCSEALADRMSKATVYAPQWSYFDLGGYTLDYIVDCFVSNDPEIEEDIRRVFRDIKRLVIIRDFAVDWVKSLKAKGYNVYYLSNYSLACRTYCPDSLDFVPYTDGGILSYEHGIIKPDRKIYELLLDKYNLEAKECVFIDDSPANIEAALQIGMEGIVYISREEVISKLEALGVK